MALDTEVQLRIDLGPTVPIGTITRFLSDVEVLCRLGGNLQEHVTRAAAIRVILLDGRSFLGDPELDYFLRRGGRSAYPLSAALASSSAFAALLDPEIRRWTLELGRDQDDETLTRFISYQNPLEIGLVVAGGGVVLALLRMIRDWSAQRRINELRADDYADLVRTRKRIRQSIADQMDDRTLPIPAELVDQLLDDTAVQALLSLGNSGVDIEVDEDPELALEPE